MTKTLRPGLTALLLLLLAWPLLAHAHPHSGTPPLPLLAVQTERRADPYTPHIPPRALAYRPMLDRMKLCS